MNNITSKQLTIDSLQLTGKRFYGRVISLIVNCKLLTVSARGYTLVELILVMSIFVTLIGLVTINLTSAKQNTVLNTTLSVFISDVKQQQLKAMIGDTEGRGSSSNYGVHLNTNNYVLFYGASYDPLEATNVTIEFGDNIQPESPGGDIIFTKVTGETTAVTITLQDTVTNEERDIVINRYGVVTAVN